ncbi:hypothetical protein FRC19_011401, partial [Serendipita sp. 401]
MSITSTLTVDSDPPYSSLIFQGITVELSAEADHSLRDVLHLVSKLKLDDRYVDKADLLSRESSPGVWDANKPLILPEIVAHFTLSVFAELGGEGPQLVASQELYGTDLCDRLGEPVTILLDGHEDYPSMILKTKITTEADIFKPALGGEQSNNQTGECRVQDLAPNSGDQTGNFEGLLQLLSEVNPDNGGRCPSYGSDNFGNWEDINKRIEMEEEAVRSTPDSDPDKPSRLSNLGSSLLSRFKRLGNVDDLDSAIAQYQAAVNLTPDSHPDKPGLLSNLGGSLLTRFERLSNIDDLDSAIAQHQTAVNLSPDGHPNSPMWLSNLGTSLLARFECHGNVDDLDSAIAQYRAAVNLTPDSHPDKPDLLNNLGGSLVTRFERLSNIDDLDSAIAQDQTAVNLSPDSHPNSLMWLTNLGDSLLTRFECLGNVDDLDSAIAQYQAAVNLTPDSHPDKPSRLNNLGNSLCIRFQRLGNIEDLDSAIARLQAAGSLTPDNHPNKPSQLNSLGNSLHRRFERLGNIGDLDSAIAQHQKAVNLSLDGHPNSPMWLSNLGTSLLARFECLGNVDDLDSAIARNQEAGNLTPDDHPNKPGQLNGLGNSLLRRFEHLRNIDDLDSAIVQHQTAVNLSPDDHHNNPMCLNNLGNSLLTRFKCLGNVDDLDSAIAQQQAAVNSTPDGHPAKSNWLKNLGNFLLTRFEHLRNVDDAEASIVQFSAASLSPIGSPSVRLTAARRWIGVAFITNHASLLTACECAITIIPLVAWLGLSIPDRHQHLAQIGGIVRDIAAIAILIGQCDKAIEWLEQGRSIVWTQILQLRTPVDELRAVEPDLADRLLHVSSLLDQGDKSTKSQNEGKQSPEEEARQYRALVREHEEIIEKIRSLPRFGDFLRPLKLHQLVNAAKEGPIVVINVSKIRCDALALVYGAEEVIHIPLPDLTSEKIIQLQAEFNSILKSSGVRMRAVRDEEVEVGGDEGCKRMLAELWDCLVKPVLDSLAFC